MIEGKHTNFNNEKQALNKEKKMPLMSDVDIAKANNLLRRRSSKEKPLTKDEEWELHNLAVKRDAEIRRLERPFNFKILMGIEITDKQQEEYRFAKEYFEDVNNLSKNPTALFKRIVYLEKLKNKKEDPIAIDTAFDDKRKNIYNKRVKKFEKLNYDIIDANRNYKFIGEDKFQALIEKLKSGEINKKEFGSLLDVVVQERKVVMYMIPDYLILTVLYNPKMTKAASEIVDKYKDADEIESEILKNDYKLHQRRIDLFNEAMRNYKR